MSGFVIDGAVDAPPVVLSNSLGTTLAMWDPQLPALTRDFRVLRYDHAGHGRAATTRVASVAELGQGLLDQLDEHGVERISFCGLSLGGAVGMWLALNAPQRIDRLVLACTSARFGTPEGWRQRTDAVRTGGVEAVADAVLALWFSEQMRRASPALVVAYRDMMISADREGYAGCCEALAAWDPGDELAAITAPTLVLAGSEDAATPPEQGAAIQRHISGARLCVLAGAGHLANLERPAEFNRLLLEHLTARPAVGAA